MYKVVHVHVYMFCMHLIHVYISHIHSGKNYRKSCSGMKIILLHDVPTDVNGWLHVDVQLHFVSLAM